MRLLILLSVILLSPTIGLAADAVATAPIPTGTELALREACADASQAAMRDCLADRAAASQKRLADAERRLHAALAAWDEDSRWIADADRAQTLAAESFRHYRDAQCAFAATLSGGAAGNARDTRRLACLASLDAARAAELEAAAGELPAR